ncbi:pyruvate dehydrogenase (acetyl-transferring) E1 component subunit alpha [Psychromicrobium xiongbiense]|uniref:pyruvate dehydrogenase (acetyl-transferring) E1 component subunit alpha n=1 Tax=Psychromicrobium xiongbiense TaxID=3051184 RepID=UPI0025560DFA|nr:pyruvate dehydrogenase (acetyl-transferring) E1 component subunit alpha [Psychromicrobium sp. YIM S02556]
MPFDTVGSAPGQTPVGATGRPGVARRGFLQVLSPQGERLPQATLDPWIAELSAEELLGLYQDMLVIRRIDAEATALQRQGELALWPPLLGQEAAQVGSVRGLDQDDFIFPSYRENGVAYLRGIDVVDVLKVWRGNAHGGWDPARHRMGSQQIIIGAQTLHAVGYALGVQFDDASTATIAYFGDGATSEGDVNEAMIFAASFQAPVVFFCQNNHWAISEPVRVQAHRAIADRAPGFGIPSLRVDGNDVLAVLAATRLAAHRARTGGGPTFIEAVTYRMGPHTTADDPTRYRDAQELAGWAARDPLSRMAAWLRSTGVLTAQEQERIDREADRVAADLRARCLELPDPQPLELFDHVYAEPHTELEAEREEYARYLSIFVIEPAESSLETPAAAQERAAQEGSR